MAKCGCPGFRHSASKTRVNALMAHPVYDFGSPAFAGHDGKVLRARTSAVRLRLYTLW
jgi:hypothetical protein